MSLKADVTIQDSEGKSDNFPCSICRGEKSQEVLTIVNSHEFTDDGLVQFWNHYLTVRCKGCGTVNFCHLSKCSEEEDFDNQGRPFLVQRKRGYPEISEKEEGADTYVDPSRLNAIASLPKTRYDTTKLFQLLTELNRAYQSQSYLSCIYLVRAVLDHVPPVWTASIRMAGQTTFILAGWTGMNVAV